LHDADAISYSRQCRNAKSECLSQTKKRYVVVRKWAILCLVAISLPAQRKPDLMFTGSKPWGGGGGSGSRDRMSPAKHPFLGCPEFDLPRVQSRSVSLPGIQARPWLLAARAMAPRQARLFFVWPGCSCSCTRPATATQRCGGLSGSSKHLRQADTLASSSAGFLVVVYLTS